MPTPNFPALPTEPRWRSCLIALALTVSTVVLLDTALAAEQPAAAPAPGQALYNVEIVIFRANSPLGVAEDWKAEAAPSQRSGHDDDPAEESGAAAAPASSRLSFQQISSAQFKLTGTDSALRRSPAYEVLAHVAWTQPATPFGGGAGIAVTELGAGQALRGQVGLEQGRYLHLNVDLSWTPADPPASLLGAVATPSQPVTFKLKQRRRMRPFEQHYFDHPAFGVIAIVTPAGTGSAQSQ